MMNSINSIQPGSWVNLNTDTSIFYDDNLKEDFIKSPIFIIYRESTSATAIDQRLNSVTWFLEYGPHFKYGLIVGNINSQIFQAQVLGVSYDDVKLSSTTESILKEAREHKRKFLQNCPDKESLFFKENVPEVKPSEQEIDNRLTCPLTLEPFKDPVTAPDGRNYERSAIVEWLEMHGTSPMTRQPMKKDQLISNFSLKPSIL